jgi:hypothetical protein
VYQEALEASAKFNRELEKDRKARLPFLESQTRVAQTLNNTLCMEPYQRLKRPGYVLAYPLKHWSKRTRFLTEANDTSALFQQTHHIYLQHKTNVAATASDLNESNSSVDSFTTHHQYIHHQNSSGNSSGYGSSGSAVKQPSSIVSSTLPHGNTRANVSSVNQEDEHQQRIAAVTAGGYYHEDDLEEIIDSDGSDYEDKRRKKKVRSNDMTIYPKL